MTTPKLALGGGESQAHVEGERDGRENEFFRVARIVGWPGPAPPRPPPLPVVHPPVDEPQGEFRLQCGQCEFYIKFLSGFRTAWAASVTVGQLDRMGSGSTAYVPLTKTSS